MALSIIINGKKQNIEQKNLQQLLDNLNPGSNSFAIAINEIFIPKSNYAVTELNNGDQLEILSPMQGG